MIKSAMAAAAIIGALSFTATALAAQPDHYPAGDAQAGQQKAATCAACHGSDGNSISPTFPKLAGQSAAYIAKELHDFKSGTRQNAIMQAMAAGLTDQDILDLAAWYSSQTIKSGAANPELVEQGRTLYLGGDQAEGVPACAACHGPAGQGMGPAGWPALAGQHAQYLVGQLDAWRASKRTNDPNSMMQDVAHNLTDNQIKAVASYLQGLHPLKKGIDPTSDQLNGS